MEPARQCLSVFRRTVRFHTVKTFLDSSNKTDQRYASNFLSSAIRPSEATYPSSGVGATGRSSQGKILGIRLATPPMLMKVLIVEQEKIVAQSLSYFVGRGPFDVFLASSGQEALSLFKTSPCDIVLCSDRLPDGDGIEVLRQLLKENPRVHSILMTVRDDESLRKEAIEAGIQKYLVKPFDLKQLEEALLIGSFGNYIKHTSG